MATPKLLILTAAWQRPKILEVYLAQCQRIRNSFPSVTFVIVGSEGKPLADLCKSYGVHYLNHNNKPVGAKWNAGLKFAKKFNPDWVMILGSDDLISNAALKKYYSLFGKGYDYICPNDIWFFDVYKQIGKYFCKNTVIGAGRCLHKSLINKCGWVLWNSSKNRCLDASMNAIITGKTRKRMVLNFKTHKFMLTDLKSGTNMWKFSSYPGGPIRADIILKHFSKKEVDLIKKLKV